MIRRFIMTFGVKYPTEVLEQSGETLETRTELSWTRSILVTLKAA